MMISKPTNGEFAGYYAGDIGKVPDAGPVAALEAQRAEIPALRGLNDDRGTHRYAEGKWSVKEVLGHLSDAERVFCYRLLRIARADPTPLAGFDENQWAATAPHHHRPTADVVDELLAVREATLALIRSLDEAALEPVGRGQRQAGHRPRHRLDSRRPTQHHVHILHERYGVLQPWGATVQSSWEPAGTRQLDGATDARYHDCRHPRAGGSRCVVRAPARPHDVTGPVDVVTHAVAGAHDGPTSLGFAGERHGVPGIVAEVGGLGFGEAQERAWLDQNVTGTRGVMQHLGMIDGDPPRLSRYLEVHDYWRVGPKSGGYLEPLVGLDRQFGDVQPGELMARVVDPLTFDVVDEVRPRGMAPSSTPAVRTSCGRVAGRLAWPTARMAAPDGSRMSVRGGLPCALALTLAVAAGCGGGSEREAGAARDTLIFAAPADATTLDPHNTTDTESDQVIGMVFEGLLGFDEQMKIVGRLAETWSVAPDGITWTFNLRKGVTLSRRDPVQCRGRAGHLRAGARPGAEAQAPAAVRDARSCRGGGRPHRALRHQVRVRRLRAHHRPHLVRHPQPDGGGSVRPRLRPQRRSDVGHGPLSRGELEEGSGIVLERVEGHWRGTPPTRRLIYRPIPEGASRVLALEAGDVDVIRACRRRN